MGSADILKIRASIHIEGILQGDQAPSVGGQRTVQADTRGVLVPEQLGITTSGPGEIEQIDNLLQGVSLATTAEHRHQQITLIGG